MSGGVDSSAVAGLLVEQGHDVIGVMMKLYDQSRSAAPTPGKRPQCCGLDDVADARRVADTLGIPFYVSNYQKEFKEHVIEPFIEAYLDGRTPNPCVRCNDSVKFQPLLKRARMLKADYLATGHYVRTVTSARGQTVLYQGEDPNKDQSYFVAGIGADALQNVLFPLGDLDKTEVRAHAHRLGLPNAEKKDSQEICFVPKDDYVAFLERAAGDKLKGPGPIVSLDGLRLGQHQGIHRYTVGQRKGLGISGPERRFVVQLDRNANTVVVGGSDDVAAVGLWAGHERWLLAPEEGQRVRARIRHRHAGADAIVKRGLNGRLEVWFDDPVNAVTGGQQLVLYDGKRVLGAATIEGSFVRGRARAYVTANNFVS
jgi:tRNA-specific 2-thiouridylase